MLLSFPDEYLNNLSYEGREKLWEDNMAKSKVYVAENEVGEIVGFSTGGKERSEKYKDYTGELYAIYILKEYQGQGLGKKLIQPVLDDLIKLDIYSMIVLVLEQNSSRYFYEAIGGKQIDLLEVKMAGQKLNELVYGWDDIRSLSYELGEYQMNQIPVEVLDDYIALMKEHLPNVLEGVYIQGSIALNAYVHESSDIDFITVTNRRLLGDEAKILTEIHNTIAEKHKNIEMDGVYILWEDLGKVTSEEPIFPVYNKGELNFEAYISPITWWIVKNNGINVIGPDRTTLSIDISVSDITSYVVENMNSYWVNRVRGMKNSIEELQKLPSSDINEGIEWTVLGLLRQYFTLKEHDIISKLGAGEYALQHVPAEWHKIIQEAINIRKGVKVNLYASNQERINDALAFSTYIINYCNLNLNMRGNA